MSPSDWALVESRLSALASPSLVELIKALYEASPGNRAMTRAHLGLEAAYPDPGRLAAAKSKIRAYVAPGPDDSFQLEAAVDVIDHYAELTGDQSGATELTVYFLECGFDAALAYGDLFREFHEAMVDMAYRCSDALADEPALMETLRPRVGALMSAAASDGSGYADDLVDALGQLDLDEE